MWTVGDSGIFTQTDIRYAPQVIHRRPTCSVAWSPNGEVLAFVQKRPGRALGASVTEFLGRHEDGSSKSENPWNQATEDLFGESTAGLPIRHRYSKSTSAARQSKSLGSSPPSMTGFNPVLSLEKALPKSKAPAARQLGAVGHIPSATMDPAVFRYLARHYSPLMDRVDEKEPKDSLQSLLESFDHNADRAEDAALFQLAQTWRIVKFSVIQELQRRAKLERQSSEKGNGSSKKLAKNQPSEKSRALDGKSDKVKSRLFKGVMGTDGHRSPLSDAENISNMATPLAQPLPDSPDKDTNHQLASLDDTVPDIQPLPPSVGSKHGTTASSDWTMSDLDDRPVAQPGHRQSQSSEDMLGPSELSSSERIRESIAQGLQDTQRSVPWDIATRPDWRAPESPDLRKGTSVEDEYDQKMEDKRAAIRDYNPFPKKILSLDSPIEYGKPAPRAQESAESFPMFSASTDSSNRAKSIGASFSPKHPVLDTIDDDDGADKPSNGNDTSAARESILADDAEGLRDDMSFEETFPDNDHIHLDRPSSPPPFVKETRPLKLPGVEDPQFQTKEPRHLAVPGVTEDLSGLSLPISPDLGGLKPWSVEVMLVEAIRHYHSNTLVDIQTAAHLLHKLHLLFYECEKIIPYEECELIYQTYNEHLLRQSLYIESAELRLLCVPTYPSVYDYAQTDTFTNVFCFTCKRPYENPTQDNTRCHRCSTPQDPCPICMSTHPPAEWTTPPESTDPFGPDPSSSDTTTSTRSSIKTELIPPSEVHRLNPSTQDYPTARPNGTALWTWCQGCGHGGHVACMSTWLSDLSFSEGGCATPGCFHDCGPGPRREQNRAILIEESKRRDSASRRVGLGFVKRDPWARGESKAVEKVRGMLSDAPVGAGAAAAAAAPAGPGAGQSSGMVSPKKVRLVTPTEQGKRRGGTGSRASIGGAGLG